MFKQHETVDRTLFVRAKKSKSFKYPLTRKWMSKEEQNTNVCYNMGNLKNLNAETPDSKDHILYDYVKCPEMVNQ